MYNGAHTWSYMSNTADMHVSTTIHDGVLALNAGHEVLPYMSDVTDMHISATIYDVVLTLNAGHEAVSYMCHT